MRVPPLSPWASWKRVRTVLAPAMLGIVWLTSLTVAQEPKRPLAATNGATTLDQVKPETAPAPRPLLPLLLPPAPECVELPPLPTPSAPPQPPGIPVKPSEKTLKEFGQFVERTVDPENFLDLVVGIPRLLVFRVAPKRIQMEGDAKSGVASYSPVTERELSLVGQKPGRTVLNLWFADPDDATKVRILSYLVRVSPDAEAAQRARERELEYRERSLAAMQQALQRYFQRLQAAINRTLPDSQVCLNVVGDTLVVSGQARDAVEARQILRMAQPRGATQGGTTPGGVLITEHGLDRSISEIVPPLLQPPALGGDILQAGAQEKPQPVPQIGGPPAPGVDKTTLPSPASFQPAADLDQLPALTVINQLRIPGEQQVMLKVTVAEINRAAARSIGVNFSIRNKQGLIVFANNTGNIGGVGQGTGGGGTGTGQGGLASSAINNLPALLDNGQVALAINALRTLNLARSLAEPTLVALNGQTARFAAGGEFPVPVVTGFTSSGLQGVSFVPFGVQLSFTPAITDKDRIRLAVNADVSVRDPQTGATVAGTTVPGLNTRNFATTVELREGQTLAVAGLLQNNFGSDATRVPLLGDIPIFGRLWSFDRTSAGDQELVVLVTPELVHPLDGHERPPLPGADSFEPTDVEFYLLGRLESRYLQDYRSPARTDFMKMLHQRQGDAAFIIGPQGHSK